MATGEEQPAAPWLRAQLPPTPPHAPPRHHLQHLQPSYLALQPCCAALHHLAVPCSAQQCFTGGEQPAPSWLYT